MSGDPPKEPSTDQPNTDSKPADRSTDQAGGGVSDRSSGPRAGEPNADASHFDESDQNADNAGTNADRRRAKADSIGMFGSRNNSGYFVFGDFHQTIGSPSVDDEEDAATGDTPSRSRRRTDDRRVGRGLRGPARLPRRDRAVRPGPPPAAARHPAALGRRGGRARSGCSPDCRRCTGFPYRRPERASGGPPGGGLRLHRRRHRRPRAGGAGLRDIETLDGALARRRSRLVVSRTWHARGPHRATDVASAHRATVAYDVVSLISPGGSALPSEQRSWWRRPST